MVVLTWAWLVVYKIMMEDWDGTSEHEEWFEDAKWTLYTARRWSRWMIPYDLALLVLLYCKASYVFETASTFLLSWFHWWYELWAFFALFSTTYCCYQYHLHPTPPVPLERVFTYRIWYRICLHPSTRCDYCSEPCTGYYWVDLALNHHWILVCDDCVDKSLRLTGIDIREHPHKSPYRNANVQQYMCFPNELVWFCRLTFPWVWARAFECIR